MQIFASSRQRLTGYACLLFSLLFSTLFFPVAGQAAETEYREILWVDLLPLEDFQALYNPPPIDHYSDEEGPARQSLRRDGSVDFISPKDDPFEKALVSTKVVPELNNTKVRLPGFVVPLEYDARQRVTEFFLVPYFGACIHLPPPPPNQIVLVSYPEGLELTSLYEAYHVEGTLLTGINDNAMALSAYKLAARTISIYEYVEEDD